MPVATPPSPVELENHPVVPRDEWESARRDLLAREKELTRLADEVAASRRRLPWVAVEKQYVFDTPDGRKTLAELFDGRSQLIVYHFMFGPGWEEGCDGCSFLADHFDGPNLHIAHHDVTLLAVSRAPLAEFQPFKTRMGWKFPWVSSHGSDFNYDFHTSSRPEERASGRIWYNYDTIDSADAGEEHHGISVFFRHDDGRIFHTYSAFARGVDHLCGAHQLLDLTPKGRNESDTMNWVRHHDRYEES